MHKIKSQFIITLALLGFIFSSSSMIIPITGNSTANTVYSPLNVSLNDFTKNISNGVTKQLVGVYANNLFALPVRQQPLANFAFVSSEQEEATQFALATQYGSIGLVAHNTLAGKHFFDLAEGDQITLIYGDGHQVTYLITQIFQFQALSPASPYSNYSDLKNPTSIMSAKSVFNFIYKAKDRLVLQTCIAKGNIDSWGRLFVVAEPVSTLALSNNLN